MTRLWTEQPGEIDADLNELLTPIARAIEEWSGRSPVVFLRGHGGFAPQVLDDGGFYIVLHGCPRSKDGPSEPRQVQPLEFEAIRRTPWPMLPASGSREAISIRGIPGARSRVFAQMTETTLWLLTNPQASSRAESDPQAAALAVLALVLRRVEESDGALRLPSHAVPWSIAQTGTWDALARCVECAAGLRSALMESRGENELLVKLRRFHSRLEQNVLLERQRLEGCEEQEARAREPFEHLRQKYLDRVAGRVGGRLQQLRHEIARISDLPQVTQVDIQRVSGTTQLVVTLKPLAMGEEDPPRLVPASRVTFTLGVARCGLPVGIEAVSPGLSSVHPHVRATPCLGSVQGPLRQCLKEGSLLAAVQLILGYLQSYNVRDQWGRAGKNWLCIETNMPSDRVLGLTAAPVEGEGRGLSNERDSADATTSVAAAE